MKIRLLLFMLFFSCSLNATPIHKNRILSLVPSNTELLFEMGFGNEIVGVSDYCNYPKAVNLLPKVGGLNLNLEKIVSLRPTIVLDLNSMHKQYHSMFSKLGINYIDFKIKKLHDIPNIAIEMAKVLGKHESGKAFATNWKQNIKALPLLGNKYKWKVYFEVWDIPMQAAGPTSFIGDIISMAGGENIINSNSEFPTVNSEQILKANPDIIFISYPANDTLPLKSRTGWSNLKSVKKDQIFILNQDLFVRPGPRNIEGLKILSNYFLNIKE